MTTKRFAQMVRGAFKRKNVESFPLKGIEIFSHIQEESADKKRKLCGYKIHPDKILYDDNEICISCKEYGNKWVIPVNELTYMELKEIYAQVK